MTTGTRPSVISNVAGHRGGIPHPTEDVYWKIGRGSGWPWYRFAHATKIERVDVVTPHRQIVHHTAPGKIPSLGVSPTSVYQQYGNLARVGVGFMTHVNRIIVAGDINIGELNDGLLCAGWQDAYQKHCQHEESR